MCGQNHKIFILNLKINYALYCIFECDDQKIIIYIHINELYCILQTDRTKQRTMEGAGNTLQVILEKLKLEINNPNIEFSWLKYSKSECF